MTPDTWFLVLSGVLWLVIVAGWAWWIRRRLQRRRRLGAWSRASATVTKAWTTREVVSSDGPTQSYHVHHGEYEFTDPSGRTQGGTHQSPKTFGTSDRLEVMYDPHEPSAHEPIGRALPLWAPLLALTFFTVGVGLFAVITLFLGLGYD